MSHRSACATGLGAALAGGLLFPAAASAHGLVGRADLPIPVWLFGWAAAIVLVISFAALRTLWPEPVLQEQQLKRVFALRGAVDVLCGGFGVLVLALSVAAGFGSTRIAADNLAPNVVYVVFWVGFVVFSAVFGDIFRLFSPWRAIARFVAWVVRSFSGEAPAPLPYPAWLGRWPATVSILAFAWLELVYAGKDDPSKLAAIILAYTAIQLVGMSLYGIDEWSERGDGFGVYFGLFARLSIFVRRDGVLMRRRPLSGAPALEILPGTVALLCVAIGSTTFDGFSQGPVWTSVGTWLVDRFSDLGLGLTAAGEGASTVGLIGCVLLVLGIYRAGIAGMSGVDQTRTPAQLAGLFVHTLIPIAFAYALAHYFSLLLYNGQDTLLLHVQPFGDGSQIDYNVLSATSIWYVQVIALVSGHVAGLVLAHDRAVALYSDVRIATRSQYWMLVVMVGFTSLGLWLLSAVNT